MIIGIIAEGSYPYISGGVSSWLSQLMENMPDVSFKILSIMPCQSDLPDYKYTLAKNVISVDTVYIDSHGKRCSFFKRYNKLDKNDIAILEDFVNFQEDFDWLAFTKLINSKHKNICTDSLLQGKPMWQHMVERYERDFPTLGFNSYIWAVKSMITPLLNFIKDIDFDADVFHAISTGYAGIIGASLKLRYSKPLILTEHGLYVKEREQELTDIDWIPEEFKKLWVDFFYFMSKGCYLNSDVIISLYKGASDIQKLHGAPQDKLDIIPNGVDPIIYKPSNSEKSVVNIGSIIRVVPIKDVITMLKAFKLVSEKLPNAVFHIIGPIDEDEEYYNKCLEFSSSLGLIDKVKFTGTLDISSIINDLDVLVFTSVSEGQPLAILEGMASGIPIVATDVGACSEMLLEDYQSGPCGLVTSCCSPTETAEAILKIVSDTVLRTTLGTNGRNRAVSKYSLNHVISRYQELYKGFIQNR